MAGTTRYITWSGGPTGDYTTDGTADQTEINAALAWANANPGNIIKMRGSGDANNPHIYSITGQINIGSSTVWTAETGACVRVANGACGSTPANCVFPNGTPVIGQIGSYVTGVEIYGFEIDGNCQNQSNQLGYVGDTLRSSGSGVERMIQLRGLSGSQTKAVDIKIHDINGHDSFGELIHLLYSQNVRLYNIAASNHQHDGFMLVEVNGTGNEIRNNTIYGITDGCLRLDNCQNFNVHHNNFFAYSGDNNNGAAKYGHNGIQLANESNKTLWTKGINIHDNYFEGPNLDGIWINDQLKKAGTVAQDVHIHHNKFSNSIAWADWAWWSSGINIGPWGNGVLIEYNTFDGCYANAIQATNAITASATHSAIVRYNNIINTLGKRAGSTNGPAVQGWGIWNNIPTKMVIKADANYCLNNLAGDYKGLTPNTISTSYITTALPDGGTDEDDPDPDPVDPLVPSPGGVYVPSTASIIDTDFGYVNRADDDFSAYINYIPFDVQRVASTGTKVIGDSKSPSLASSNLTDFDYEGSELELDCISHDMDSFNRIMAAFSRRGRSYLELGGPNKGYFVSGVMPEHGSSFDKAQGDIPEEDFEYHIRFKTEYPYKESTYLTVRDHYCYNSMKFSADDIFAGNIVKNHSFENWNTKQLLEWELTADAADNEWRNVKYSPELAQWCAVAQTGTNNRIMISPDSETWTIPTGLTSAANCNNAWRGLAWCSEWGMWVATSISGLAGYACITSVNGEAWTAKATPVAADGMSWGDVLWIPPNTTVPNGRVIVFAYAGTGNRAMYSDDKCATWVMVQTASDTTNWMRSAYSPKLNRIVVVAYAGATGQQAMYSDDCGATWTIITTPTPNQQWAGLIWADLLDLFIACSDDGTQQVMTSPTGITWTLRDTPYAYTEKTDGIGEVVGTIKGDTNIGWNYTTLATTYTTSVNPMYTFVLPALANGNIYRLDNFHCQLRAVASGATASMKVTVQAASLYLGVETDIKEWTETSTSYRQKSYDSVLESATNETVTIRFYLKSSTGSIRAGATIMGYEASEMTAGGSTIIYHRNQWRDLTYASELNLMVAVCQDTSYNYTMYSANGIVWQKVAAIVNQAWNSVEYSEDQKTFVAVSSSGTDRIMLSTGYGEMKDVAPTNWTLVEKGQERSDEHTIDGTYSLHISGDGTTEEPGSQFQKLPFDSMYDVGEMYIFSAYGYVEGLTSGSFSVDIYAGGTIVKELVWSADTEEPITKELQFIFDTIPSDVYIRARGADTPNAGSHFYLDNIIISKRSEFEQSSVGAEIVTDGYSDVIPNVTIRGVGTATDSGTSNRTISDTDEEEYTSTAITYGTKIKEVVFPALAGGSKYRLDELSMRIKSSSAVSYTYSKVTLQAASLFGGVETDIAMYTTNFTTYQTRTYVLPYDLITATNETVTLRWYIRASELNNTASVTYLGYKLTEILDAGLTKTTSIHLYNDADTRKIMKCCNTLPPGFMVTINKNNTGSYRYTEPFENDNYILNAYEITGAVARNAEDQTLVMPIGSSITFYFDTLYAVAGIPFIKLFTVSGIPQIFIADNSGTDGAPGTFYSVDSNTSSPVEMTEVIRELDNLASIRLRGKNEYYVKITPATGTSCEFGQMLEYAALDTIDAQRFYIYAAEKPNSIGVVVGGTGKCSAVVSLGYRDANILP